MNPNLRTIRVGMKPPIDTKNTYNVIMYAGSVFRKEDGTCEITAIQLTSIPKIEPWILEAISRPGLHAIISGGGFGEKFEPFNSIENSLRGAIPRRRPTTSSNAATSVGAT